MINNAENFMEMQKQISFKAQFKVWKFVCECV